MKIYVSVSNVGDDGIQIRVDQLFNDADHAIGFIQNVAGKIIDDTLLKPHPKNIGSEDNDHDCHANGPDGHCDHPSHKIYED